MLGDGVFNDIGWDVNKRVIPTEIPRGYVERFSKYIGWE